MAVPVARVHLAMAHAALPGLLPSPPKCKLVPLLPTPPSCVVILPISTPPKPSRADADERWDARKSAATKSPSKQQLPSRADAVDRWDTNKIAKPASPASSGSSSVLKRSPATGKSSSSAGPASSSERWDSNKKTMASSSSSSSSSISASRRESSGERWDSNKRRVISRASSAERWDAHKKPRPPQADDGVDDDGESSTASNDMELDTPQLQQRLLYAGPGFIASPEPSMLPMPSFFMVRVAA